MAIVRAILFVRINVMDIEQAEITDTALDTLATQTAHQFYFAFPLSMALLLASVPIVPRFLTLARTESSCARFAAGFALAGPGPARGCIAGLTAILSSPITKSISVHCSDLATMSTDDGSRCLALLSHGDSISYIREPRYFDIACERIRRAYLQPRLFDDPPPAPVQEELL